MKKIKKMLSLILAITLLMANMTTVFAAKPKISTGEPEKHAIEVTIEPNETYDGIMPLAELREEYRYNNEVLRGNIIQTYQFYFPERYMRFDACAIDTNGNSADGEVIINLRRYVSEGLVAKLNSDIDGTTSYLTWIDAGRGWYYFSIQNKSNSHINLSIILYSLK